MHLQHQNNIKILQWKIQISHRDKHSLIWQQLELLEKQLSTPYAFLWRTHFWRVEVNRGQVLPGIHNTTSKIFYPNFIFTFSVKILQTTLAILTTEKFMEVMHFTMLLYKWNASDLYRCTYLHAQGFMRGNNRHPQKIDTSFLDLFRQVVGVPLDPNYWVTFP